MLCRDDTETLGGDRTLSFWATAVKDKGLEGGKALGRDVRRYRDVAPPLCLGLREYTKKSGDLKGEVHKKKTLPKAPSYLPGLHVLCMCRTYGSARTTD